jgi:hypothetical protein
LHATNSIRALMTQDIQPPIMVQFNASSVPVLEINLSSDALSEQQLDDYGINRICQQLAPAPATPLGPASLRFSLLPIHTLWKENHGLAVEAG